MLAGPVLRRTEADRVCIWLATSAGGQAHAEIFSVGGRDRLELVGGGTGKSIRLGPNLHVFLVSASPEAQAFPADRLLAYDLEIEPEATGSKRALADLGLLSDPESIVYGDLPLPTFYIRHSLPALHVLHGSCRLLHGGGEDALVAADEVLSKTARALDERPGAIFLTGDQIYADDVGGPMIGHIRRLAGDLMGPGDASSMPGIRSLDTLAVDGRADVICDRARFTSEKPGNHLMSFGEFAAMYLMAWSPDAWPGAFPAARRAIPGERRAKAAAGRARRKYTTQVGMLMRARFALPAVRRVLANTPAYMIFDDHDVTDDWNLTDDWKTSVRESPLGRRIIANALAAYWAFQGLGNDPDAHDGSIEHAVSGFLSGAVGADEFESALWNFDRWSYSTPTSPPAVVLDTRTQRHYDSPEGGARLMGSAALDRIGALARDSGHEPGKPLIIVSPVPVFGFELQERRQKYLVGKLGPYEIDFEAWHSNLRGLVDFMRLLVEDLQPSPCLIMSGDVHYGVNAEAYFSIQDQELCIVQLVSSGYKHAGFAAKKALDYLGRLLSLKHERLGWEEPPDYEVPEAAGRHIVFRSVNVDEWADDSPIFLAPRDIKILGIETPPDFRECRIYVRPEGRRRSVLIGENNVGLVSLRDEHVVHRVLSRSRKKTHVHQARVHPRPAQER